MRSCNLFLLVYLAGSCFGASSAQRNVTCASRENCGEVPDSTSHFLQCVGLQPTDTGRDHMRRLKGMLEATMDVYTFTRSSMSGVPLLSLQGELAFNPRADPFQNEALVQMWMDVKIKPLLKSITRHFLSCLSTKTFSCSTYQTVVRELSHYYSEMNPDRQKWIYAFFMYPFLSGDRVAGCVNPEESSEEWLMKNFGAFRAMARIEDFSTLNMVFSGLEVLHLLSPAQKAELLLRPEVASLDNRTLSLVFRSLLTGGTGPPPTASPGGGHSWTTPGYPSTYYPQPTYNPYPPPSPLNSFREVVNGFMTAFRPVGSLVHEFVSFTRERDVSEIRSSTLTQFMLNWTLAKLADVYRPHNTSIVPEMPKFDVTNVEDWYRQVVMPILQRFLPNDEALLHENITLAFHEVFYLEHGMDNETYENMDVCSITLDKSPCGLTDAVQNVANIFHCAARTNLTMSEPTIMRLILELTGRLNSLIKDLSNANFSEMASDFRQIFSEADSPSMTQEHLEDSNFIKLWFQAKLMPLLPEVPAGLLSCLSTKNFSCPVYQTIVAELSQHMTVMEAEPIYSHNVYDHFIHSFLLHHNTSDPQCLSSGNHSAEWLKDNFGFFSRFASITDFYQLNPNFSGLEVLELLSPKQTAEMLLLPLPTPPEKHVVINRVFDFLLESPEDRNLMEVLFYVVQLAKEIDPPCGVYRHIFDRLYEAIPSLSLDMEPATWAAIDDLINLAPEDCVPDNITCPATLYNGTNICRGINSSDLHSYMSTSMEVSCNFTLQTYACAQLENFTANQLVSLLKCDLPGNSSHSKVLWKMLLTKLSFVLDPALDILADTSIMVGPSASEVLDVIGEIRVSMLTDEQLMNSSVIRKWFSGRLSAFLPSASGRFLHCLSSRNLSCHSYQQILQVFIHHFDNMTLNQQHVIVKNFILRFLLHSGPKCLDISNSSAEWLMKNLGPFSGFLSLAELLRLNPEFSPLEALQLLSPKQTAELVVLPLSTLPDKDVIINMIFNHLTDSPDEKKFTEFLSDLVMFLPRGNLTCSSYKTLFTRLDLAMVTASVNVASSIMYSKMALSQHLPAGCIIYSGECHVTMTNETDICVGVNSTMLQLHLDSGQMSGRFCDFAVEEFACASLSALRAEDLASMVACNRSSISSSSRPVWKLLLSKASHVLEEALDHLSNKTLDPRNPVLSMVLDSIREIRLDIFNVDSLKNPAIIQLWFNHRLRPFLPAVSPEFLSCLATKGLNCSTYQHIVQILSHLQPHMTLHRQMSVYTHFIKVLLTRNNTADPQCLSSANHSAEWLKDNFGFFSRFASITDFYQLNPNFSGLEVLELLSPKQTAEMLLLPLPTPPEKHVVINRVFDFLLESPEDRNLMEVLFYVVQLAKEIDPPCGVYRHIFDRLYEAIPSLSPDVEPATWAAIDDLKNLAPKDCVPDNITCPATLYNGTNICRGINSSDLHSYMSTSMEVSCKITLQTYACAQLENFTANQLVSLLKCDLPGNSSHSKVLWKMLLTKLSFVLDPALDILADTSIMVGPSASEVLDVIGEIRVSMLTDEQLMNSSVIRKWFSGRLSAFLPSASGRFLHCLSSRNLSCHSYQQILQVFIHHFDNMTLNQQHVIVKNFILRFLLHSGPKCLDISNSSAEWLMKNLGPFSGFLSLAELLRLNPEFSPLEALQLLSPKQTAELVVLPLSTLPDKDVIINMIFDHLTDSPDEKKFTDFLSDLVMFPPRGNLTCSSYKTLFTRLDLAMVTASVNVASSIMYSKMALSQHLPAGCIIYSGECHVTMTNETDICVGVNSTMLQLHLDSGQMSGRFCDFAVEEFACASLSALRAEDLASMVACNRSSISSSSRPVWKLLLSKASHVLEEALDHLSNKTLDPRNPVLSMVLDSIREIRLDIFNVDSLKNPAIIQLWFNHRLRPFLPAVSPEFLSCLTTKGLNCSTYQHIVQILSHLQPHMTLHRQMSVYTHFIKVLLTRNNTADPQCLSSANHSAEWLKDNFGFFSRFASITDFYQLNPNFSGLEVLELLSPKQTAEMLLLPLPTPPEKHVVINRVFDFLLESPEDRNLMEVLFYVVQLAKEIDPPCGVYRHIFDRLYEAIPSLSPDVEPATWAAIDDLINLAPEECVPENITCPATLYNGTNICRGINSSDLHSYMSTSMEVSCKITLQTYACAQLENFTANQLVSLLKCDLPGNSSHSKVLWKMLLTKLSFVLDPALDILADTSIMVGPSASEVLDVIGEIRVSMLTDEQLMNSSVIRKWFSGRLSVFLPSASGRFLHCLSSRNLSCHSYQQILQVFILHFDNMTLNQQHVIVKNFILRFLLHSGPKCLDISNSSAEWLMKNLGPFSGFLSLAELLRLKPEFSPLEALQLLSPKQTAELVVLPLSTLPDKDVIINMIFDHLTDSPDEKKFTEFLSDLVMFLPRGNVTCSSYKTLFTRLDLAMVTASVNVASSIMYSKMALSQHLPAGCIIYSGECHVTMTNETDICVGVNSTMLQLHLDSGQMSGRFCDFAVEEFACASLSALRAEDLASMVACNRSSNFSSSRPVWKLLLSKASHVLEEALDHLSNKTLDPRNPVLSMVLDSIREIRLDIFNVDSLKNPAIIQLWFNHRLRPFLPAVSPEFLSCLATKGLNCSTYQHIVQILSHLQPHMTLHRQMSVYTHFIKVLLTRNNTADPSCSLHTSNSGEWLQKNLGGFSVLVSVHELQNLYPNFSAMEALSQLTVRQLAEVSATPGQLTSPDQVTMVMKHISKPQLSAFFDDFSPAIMGHQHMFPPAVISAMLQVVFDRANLSDHSVGDSVVLMWLHNRLRPLLVNLSPLHVAPFFSIFAGRNCSTQQLGVEDLNSTMSSLSEVTQTEIHNHIIQTLKGPIPLQCYGDNYNHSFYSFLRRSFVGFGFPNLSTFLSLMPHNRMHQLMNSMPPSDLGDFLRLPDVVDNDAELCVIYNNYDQTPVFLETESLPAVVQRPTLPCVWPMALSSSKRSEVNAWFDRRLHNYLVFLTNSLISPNSTHNASCLAFQKLISVLGEYNYTAADFMRQDVFNTIRAYLTSATVPRCYDPNDPELNSTAWFAEYIGPFMPFLTLEELQTFGSAQVIQVFTVNPLNIALLNHSVLPLNLTNYYTELIYQQDSNFNPLLLPLLCRCIAPGPAFSQLTEQESMIVLHNLTTLCTDLDPQVSAALAGNLGDNIDSTAISALGNESTGMSTGQIMMIKPQDLLAALSTLSSVVGWNDGQARAIILSLMSSGMMQLNEASSLFQLGSLVVGVPATTFSSINGSQLITASKNPSFLVHLMSAPMIVKQTFVTQIVSVDSSSEMIIQNVPDELATEIPRALLLGFSSTSSVLTTLNQKKWKRKQVELFFDVIAVETSTAAIGSANNLSSSVLQGFTCTGVRTIKKVQIKKLIKACRRKGKNKVILVETQLTCMYNYIKGDSDVTSFDLYPPDMLLYYDYSLVPQASCRSYFEQLGDADFSVFSSALSYKLTDLFANARSCLGITNTSLTEDTITVLGNMCCTLDGSYIENSDPSILEKLKNCPDLTSAQAAAVEALLQSGRTQYGAPSEWNEQTLQDLGMLPLYLTSTFYDNFDKKVKRRFLKSFLKVIRSKGVNKQKRRAMKKEIRKSIKKKSKRSIENECTVGEITQVTISDETFPFDYDDINQFNCCLSAAIVKNNLDSITGKVDQEDYLAIVLSKLREAYAGSSSIPESQVQLLGPASRVATINDINMWNITVIDTLSALMDSSNGDWDPSLAKAIISKYLNKEGNKLGSAELNAIGGVNLCSLDANVLKSISQQSLKNADALTVSNCTTEKKTELFTIASKAFATSTRSETVSASTYQLMQPYLGGADKTYIQSLSASNINMDLNTFISLNENVVLSLTVSEVKDLLGSNLADLKSYENQTLVQSWIKAQPQSQLDTLGLELTGGRADPTVSPNLTSNSVTAATNSSSSETTAGSSTSAGNSGGRVRASAGFSFLVLLALLIAPQHILV